MKIVNAVVISTLLSVGLAGNALAAPKGERHGHGAKKVVVVKQPARKAHRHVVKKRPAKRVVKRVIKRAPANVYRIRPGDTLYTIAARNRISVSKLIKLNNLWGHRSNNLRVGMTIRLF
ncbi:LysM peptidoglycan-binding domain-containing protein [Leucothrix sargassi]|nr:LysM peptidoglycan-binding domain-containing protein [Leucothrix sargassi]